MSEGTVRMFPVLWPYASELRRALLAAGCPYHVPFDLVLAHEGRALVNHGQTVQRLAERGGLSPNELLAVLEDRRYLPLTAPDATARILAHVERWQTTVYQAVAATPKEDS